MNCIGLEESLSDCVIDSQHHCNHAEGASVICRGQLLADMNNKISVLGEYTNMYMYWIKDL